VDIVLKYNNSSFTLTNICLGGKFNCPAISLVKTALLWVSDDKPNLEQSSKYNDYTLGKEVIDDNPPIVISTDPTNNFVGFADLKQPLYGKYIHIKLIDTFTKEEIKAAVESQKKTTTQSEQDGDKGADDGDNNIDDNGNDKGEDKSNDSEDEAGSFHQSCIVAEFLGLWGFNGKQAEPKVEVDTKNLFTALSSRYDKLGTSGAIDLSSNFMTACTNALLKALKDYETTGALEESEEARAQVAAMMPKLSWLGSGNVVTLLVNLLPIVHIFRLFYGYHPEVILKGPM